MLVDRNGKPIPQIYDPEYDRYIPLTLDIYRDVVIRNLPKNHVGYSSDTKPAGKEGDSFIELDTKKVFLHDGTKWSEF